MPSRSSALGFGLLETVVAAGLLILMVVGVAQLTAMSTAATRASGHDTTALLLATQKMEQIRSLRWRFDRAGRRESDEVTDLTVDPPTHRGVGLRPSPGRSLERSVSGYVDYLDTHGRWLGNGTAVPDGTAFVRRWSVRPWSAGRDLLTLDVVVVPVRLADRTGWTTGSVPPPGVTWLTTMRVRD